MHLRHGALRRSLSLEQLVMISPQNTQAYAYNMTEVEPGVWAFWSGDISDGFSSGVQDGIIESGDYSQLENAANTFIFGYDVNDITGDGLVESSDYSLVENNIVLFLFSLHP